MQILFADESPSPPKKPGKCRYFAISGVVIPEALWRDVAHDLSLGVILGARAANDASWRRLSSTEIRPALASGDQAVSCA